MSLVKGLPTEEPIEVPRKLHDLRFDAALTLLFQSLFPQEKPFSRGYFTKLIEEKKVLLNGVSAKPSVHVAFRDSITFTAPEDGFSEKKTPRGFSAIEKIFEDEHILALNKPAHVSMHQTVVSKEITIADWIVEHYPELQKIGEDVLRPGIVHRLDKETSGVVVIAKTEESFQALKKLFQERNIEKTYIALVYGNVLEEKGEIRLSLMRRSGELKRKAVNIDQSSEHLLGNVRTALTHYRVLSRYESFDLVEVRPKTGRTHQIRVHFSALGHPIVGDKLYAFKPARRKEILFPERQLLHAHTLTFTLFKKKYTFSAPLPADFKTVLSRIDETRKAGYDDRALKSLETE